MSGKVVFLKKFLYMSELCQKRDIQENFYQLFMSASHW